MSRHWKPSKKTVELQPAARPSRIRRDPVRSDEDLAWLEGFARQLARDELRSAGRDPESCQIVIPHEGFTIEI